MKKLLLTLLALFFLSGAPVCNAAGIPVIDSANLSQSALNFAKELQEMVNQLNMLKSQLEQQITQYKALVGDRGMGGLLDGQIRNYIPEDWANAFQMLDQANGYSGLSSQVQALINQNKAMSDSQLGRLSPEARQLIENDRRAIATHQALGSEAYKSASERFALLQNLTNQIGAATDPKAIMDLQARIQTEQNALANEATKLQGMAESLRSEELIRQQKIREHLSKSASYMQ